MAFLLMRCEASWRNLLRRQRLHGRSMNNAVVDREDGPVTRAVPGSVGVILCHGAAFMSARRRNSMGYAIGPFPHSDPASAEIHYCAATWLDVVETVHQGSAVAALVEFSRDLAHGVVRPTPNQATRLGFETFPRSRSLDPANN
jgi:hypothetical protein